MSVLTSSRPLAATALAAPLVSDLTAGRVARQSFGERSVAFEWAAGLPNILARQVSSAVVDGLSFTAVRVAPSGTPAGEVPPGGVKPDAVTISSDPQNLTKYAGIANFQTEQQLSTDGLVPALASVITTSCLLAFDADCGAALDADNGVTAGGTDWPSAVLAGIAAVAAQGGAPSVLVLAAADYATAVQSPGVGYALSPVDGIPALFGCRIVLMAGLVSRTRDRLDPARS